MTFRKSVAKVNDYIVNTKYVSDFLNQTTAEFSHSAAGSRISQGEILTQKQVPTLARIAT